MLRYPRLNLKKQIDSDKCPHCTRDLKWRQQQDVHPCWTW